MRPEDARAKEELEHRTGVLVITIVCLWSSTICAGIAPREWSERIGLLGVLAFGAYAIRQLNRYS